VVCLDSPSPSSRCPQLMAESRLKFQSYWSAALRHSHPVLDTPPQSHGALSALLLSRDTRSCHLERVLLVACSLTDAILISRQVLSLQVLVQDGSSTAPPPSSHLFSQMQEQYLLTILIDPSSLCPITSSSVCPLTCSDDSPSPNLCEELSHQILEMYPLELLRSLSPGPRLSASTTPLVWNVFVRMLRAIGVEVLWSPQQTHAAMALCPGEMALWERLRLVLQTDASLSSSSSPLDRFDLNTEAAQCRTDVDDCDCGLPIADTSAGITISHLLDERRGFYHLAVVLSSWSPLPVTTTALSVEAILPLLAKEIQTKDLTISEPCVARHHFPPFFEWRYDMPGSRESLSVVSIPFHSSATTGQAPSLHLRRAADRPSPLSEYVKTSTTFRLPRTIRNIRPADLLLLADQLRRSN
jgi:hypothetical protein